MSLCTPAFIYVVLSSIGIIILAYHNYENSNLYCVGNVKCPVQSTTPMFVAKVLYVIFWTFVLNTLCNYGYYKLSWFILLLPFIIFFIIIAIIGQFINKQTTNMIGSGANYMGQGQQQQQQQGQQQYYTYQQQASAQQAPKQQKDNSQQQMQEQEQTGQAAGSYYSSYSDYDHALDDRTKQMDKESQKMGQAQYHY